jgi:hypothetical protein
LGAAGDCSCSVVPVEVRPPWKQGMPVRVRSWGVDLHRRRSVIVRIDAVTGEQLGCVRIENSRARLVTEVLKAGPAPRVAIEATFGWYWAVDALQAAGAEVHLAHPRGMAGMTIGGSRTTSGMRAISRICCG